MDDGILNTCESTICPILLLELLLAKVCGNMISFSASKHKGQLNIVSGLSDEIETLDKRINSSD